MNCNMLKPNNALADTCDMFDLSNLVKSATCFKSEIPSLVDVILTNKPKSFSGSLNVDIGCSDFHNLVAVASRMFAPKLQARKIVYRSMKHFDDDSFRKHIESLPLHVCQIFDDIDDIHRAQNHMLMSVIDQHAPVKTKFVKGKYLPYINSELRKTINQRNMWRNRHFRNRQCKVARKMYTTLRNKVVKLKHKSIQRYFDNKCGSQAGNRNFYKIIKPIISQKSHLYHDARIILREDDNIVSDPVRVADIFNKYYLSLADYDCDYDGLDTASITDIICKHSSHSSVNVIKKTISSNKKFNFSIVSEETFLKYMNKLDVKKAIGHDGLATKFLKICGAGVAKPFSELFNLCILSATFPTDMKLAEISPVFKKNDNLDKVNYRSVNILTAISKVFEYILSDQMTEFFIDILHSSVSAYRKGYSCQHVLLKLTEHWRDAFDADKYVGIVAMDLSKAFDSMPHGLLIAKLHAYGVSLDACNMITSYLINRQQRVKVSGQVSEWSVINRGVPQGSVLGPLLFNLFLNDLFFVELNGNIANYADDNHLYNENACIKKLICDIENDSNVCLSWFENNRMVANPKKFRGLITSRDGKMSIPISVDGNTIISANEINVLGVTLDDKLKFNSHVQSLCFRASRQINSFKRIAKYLNVERRLAVLKSFILSNFSYCPVTWIFCGKKNCAKLEKLQERALRIVFNDGHASYETLCESANILPLNVYRVLFLGIEVYKCVNGLNPKYMNDMLVIRPNADRLRDSSRAIQPRFSSVGFGFKSFKYFGAKLWNVLPITVKRSDNLFIFKDRLTEWCHANRSLDIFDIC